MRPLIAGAMLLALVGCRDMTLPDEGVAHIEADRRGELVIQGWEQEIGRAAQKCRFTLLGISCSL